MQFSRVTDASQQQAWIARRVRPLHRIPRRDQPLQCLRCEFAVLRFPTRGSRPGDLLLKPIELAAILRMDFDIPLGSDRTEVGDLEVLAKDPVFVFVGFGEMDRHVF